MRKPKKKWRDGVDGCPHAMAPALTSLRCVADESGCEKTSDWTETIGEWMMPWGGRRRGTGETSVSLRGSFQLTLVPRERKGRDSNVVW